MNRTDFSFNLPDRLIAQEPPAQRGQSRLMLLNRATGARTHHSMAELPDLVPPGSLFVFNNSRVRKARITGVNAQTGTRVDFLLVKRVSDTDWHVLVPRSRRRHAGSRYVFDGGVVATLTGESSGDFRLLSFDQAIDDAWLDRSGHLPLPPYIRRPDTPADAERYQTVYAAHTGSAAAPTAGLHFTEDMLSRLKAAGMETAFVTLHVGLGTFLPVRTEVIEDHPMHEECFCIDDKTAEAVEGAKAAGRAVIAVGTTSVRTLESAWKGGRLVHGDGATAIFIYPGYQFKVIDALFTNFHTPESTLLMLVSAFAGREFILDSYTEAIHADYRFFSYGDAMLIL